MKSGFMVGVVFGVATLVANPGEAEAGILSACEVDVHGALVCVDAAAACIVGLQVHLCIEPCTFDLLGNLKACAQGEQTCSTLLGDIRQCPGVPPLPACQVDANAEILCVDASAQCLLNGQIELCVSEPADPPADPEDPPTDPEDPPTDPEDPTPPDDPTPPEDPTDPSSPDDMGGMRELSSSEGSAEEWNAYGGGCSTSNASSSWLLAVGLGVVLAARRRKRARAIVVASVALVPAVAGAEINADLVRSQPMGDGGIAVDTASTLESKQVRISALTGYADDPVELRNMQGDTLTMIDSMTTLDVHIGVGIGAGLELEASLPMVVQRAVHRMDADATAIGDIGVGAKWSARGSRAGFALAGELVAPTGGALATDGGWGGTARVVADARIGDVTFAANASLYVRSRESELEGARYAEQVSLGGLVDVPLAPRAGVHLIGEIYATRALGDSTRGNPSEALGSLRWRSDAWTFLAGAGAGLSNSVGVPDWRVYLGGSFTFGHTRREAPMPRLAQIARTAEPPPPAPLAVPAPAPAPEPMPAVALAEPVPAPAPEPPPAPAPAYVFTEATPLVFHDIHFETNKWRILPTSYRVLDDIAASLQAQPEVRIRIEGHTDGRGKDAFNLMLSQQRALATLNYLVAAGIDAGRLEYQGYGLSRPIASNTTAAGRAENRRVEIRTLSKGGK